MLIILEGPDKSGKTTLAKALAKKLGWSYQHCGPPGPDPAAHYRRLLLGIKTPTVLDRSHLGELVYGPLLRGKAGLDWLQVTALNRLVNRLGGLVIHADLPEKLLQKRFLKSRKELVTPAQNLVAGLHFRELMEAWHNQLTIKRYESIDKKSLQEMVERVWGTAALHSTRAAPLLRLKPKGYGSLFPKTLIIGEALNRNVTYLGLPFDGGRSSLFLAACLVEAGAVEKDLYFMNAETFSLKEAERVLGQDCKVLALGNKAQKLLPSVGFGRGTHSLPHPQAWLRFHFKERFKYVQALREALA